MSTLEAPPLTFNGVLNAFTSVAAEFSKAAAAASNAFYKISIALEGSLEVTVSGIEARHYVRGAMQPERADERVQRILRGESPEVSWLPPEHRARVAAAHIRGAAEAGTGKPEVLAWHRLLGREAVSVR